MTSTKSNGYDAAQSRREEDDLGRWRFSAEIVDIVLSTDPDWSARIGIFGKWGDGKSTVLRFAEHMLRERNSVVFWFNPWAVQNWNDLWKDFGNRLSAALSSAGIPIDNTWLKFAKDSTKWLEKSGVEGFVRTGFALAGRDKAADVGFGLVSKWLKYDGPQIRAIQQKVKNRRLVVLVDDLDRCAPEMLPQLLLSLRELLDLPGFTFLLAFDNEIVAKSLVTSNPAWSSGPDFLEKILDFQFHLPVVTLKQKKRLLERSIEKYCPFVPSESVEDIQDLLPDSPRKLKILIRSMAALKPQITRHDPDELNWKDLWLAQMLRLESYTFIERLLIGDTLDKQIGSIYRLLEDRSKTRRDRKNEEDDPIYKVFEESGVTNAAVKTRLFKLVQATRARSFNLKYACELAIQPHAITWREFRQIFELWSADRTPQVITGWIEQHASRGYVSVDEVETQLFDSIVTRRLRCLSSAAASSSITELESNTGEASLLWDMAGQFLNHGRLGASEFKRLYEQAFSWIGFTRNPSDKGLRIEEENLLLSLLSSASPALTVDLFEIIYPDEIVPVLAELRAAKSTLRKKSLDIIAPELALKAIEYFKQDGGIHSLSESGRLYAIKYCLFHSESPVWKPDALNELLTLIRNGKENSVVFLNVLDYFNTIALALAEGIDSIRRENVASILKNDDLVRCIWETVISRGIQYRMQIAYLRSRKTFIANGASEALMPLTEDLKLRLLEMEKQAQEES
jgi:KAP family P-loop domain